MRNRPAPGTVLQNSSGRCHIVLGYEEFTGAPVLMSVNGFVHTNYHPENGLRRVLQNYNITDFTCDVFEDIRKKIRKKSQIEDEGYKEAFV